MHKKNAFFEAFYKSSSNSSRCNSDCKFAVRYHSMTITTLFFTARISDIMYIVIIPSYVLTVKRIWLYQTGKKEGIQKNRS